MKASNVEPSPAFAVDPMLLHLIELWRHTPLEGGDSTVVDNDYESEVALVNDESLQTMKQERRRPRRPEPSGRHRDESIAPILLTVPQVADVLCKTPKAVYEMLRRGQLPGVTRIGRRCLIRRDALLHWLDHKCASSDRSIR